MLCLDQALKCASERREAVEDGRGKPDSFAHMRDQWIGFTSPVRQAKSAASCAASKTSASRASRRSVRRPSPSLDPSARPSFLAGVRWRIRSLREASHRTRCSRSVLAAALRADRCHRCCQGGRPAGGLAARYRAVLHELAAAVDDAHHGVRTPSNVCMSAGKAYCGKKWLGSRSG